MATGSRATPHTSCCTAIRAAHVSCVLRNEMGPEDLKTGLSNLRRDGCYNIQYVASESGTGISLSLSSLRGPLALFSEGGWLAHQLEEGGLLRFSLLFYGVLVQQTFRLQVDFFSRAEGDRLENPYSLYLHHPRSQRSSRQESSNPTRWKPCYLLLFCVDDAFWTLRYPAHELPPSPLSLLPRRPSSAKRRRSTMQADPVRSFDPDHARVLVVGPMASGKTTLVHSLCHGEGAGAGALLKPTPTVGCNVDVKVR